MNKDKTIRMAHPQFSDALQDSIDDILAGGRLIQGEYRRAFEAALAAHFGVKHAVTFNSGTTALFAALHSLDLDARAPVIVPDYGFIATANAVEFCGADAVFADVDPDDCGLSPAWLVDHAPPNAAAVVVVHQFGLPAKLTAIREWADRHGARVIEDSACALGTTCDGVPLGAASGIGVLSFHPRKIVTTGDGGALLTDEDEFAARATALANHGRAAGIEARLGLNLRLPEIACAMGLEQLARLGAMIAVRRKIGEAYGYLLADSPLTLPAPRPGVGWNHQTYFVLLPAGVDRARLLEHLHHAGIEANVPAQSLSDDPLYRDRGGSAPARTAVSCDLARRAVGVPCHDSMTIDDARRVADVLLRALDAARIGA
ncbi:MAG: DegT/DnrJ/EryC1/StrS family aminotransferase [Candidatus Lernaella stagnicola]|nr:DegT/DnrJ/EryC1/StrS family aminotransferase [Candidatus Lernaella stagnicola]